MLARLARELAARLLVSSLILTWDRVAAAFAGLPPNQIIQTVALLGLVSNGPYYLATRTGWRPRAQAYARIVGDIALVTAGLYGAGGLAAAPYLAAYLPIAIHAGVAFSSRAGVVAAWLATVAYVGMVLVDRAIGHASPVGHPLPEGWVVASFNLLIINVVSALTAWLAAASRRSHRRLRESEERFRAITDSAPEAIVTVDDAGRITSWNPGARNMFGYESGEILGQPLVRLMPERYREAHVRAFSRSRATGQLRTGGRTLELHAVRHDGQEFPIELSVALWRSPQTGMSFSAIIRDTTERKRLEAQVAAGDRMEALGRLAGGIAHDFNNLLMVILGQTELLRARGGLGPEGVRALERMQRATDDATVLIRQLLALSGKPGASPRTVDLNAVVREVEPRLRRFLGEAIMVEVVVEAGPTWVRADPGQLRQALLTLAASARETMPTGGQFTVETATVELVEGPPPAGSPRPGWYGRLTARDTGRGVDPAAVAHMFEPFFATGPVRQGTGLGLATVYGAVTQSGGTIGVDSRPGHGTTVTIHLPRVSEPERSPAAEASPTETRGTETLLLVEDDEAVRDIMVELLQAAGYRVLEAPTGRGALEVGMACDGPIHLLVADLGLPDMSGQDVALRLAVRHPDLRVLFISGYPDDVIAQSGVIEPGPYMLQKPFSADTLCRQVRAVLEAPPAASRPQNSV
jgi:two-component system, cell cycle sensor histidine kinase and response regulator CckA